MIRSKEFRRRADACQRMAEKAGNDTNRANWIILAVEWLRLIPKDDRIANDYDRLAEGRAARIKD
jgi:hypothetical protein